MISCKATTIKIIMKAQGEKKKSKCSEVVGNVFVRVCAGLSDLDPFWYN